MQKYFKSPPKSPVQSLHKRTGLGKVNRPVPQLATSYLAAANPNLSKRRDKVRLFFTGSQNISIYMYFILHIWIILLGKSSVWVR